MSTIVDIRRLKVNFVLKFPRKHYLPKWNYCRGGYEKYIQDLSENQTLRGHFRDLVKTTG